MKGKYKMSKKWIGVFLLVSVFATICGVGIEKSLAQTAVEYCGKLCVATSTACTQVETYPLGHPTYPAEHPVGCAMDGSGICHACVGRMATFFCKNVESMDARCVASTNRPTPCGMKVTYKCEKRNGVVQCSATLVDNTKKPCAHPRCTG